MRPGRSSVFLRDEFSGLLEAMTKKDYYAGMQETLCKLYDGKLQKRVLRKETIEVRDPVLILFAGGIRDSVLSLLTSKQVESGFVPRFIFILAESDITKRKPLGPPTERSTAQRDALVEQFRRIYKHFIRTETITVGSTTVTRPRRWDVELTPAAWNRWNAHNDAMTESALKSNMHDFLLPCFDRLCHHGLRIAALLAATRMGEKVVVTEQDLAHAFKYVDKWKHHTLRVLEGVGNSAEEHRLQRVHKAVIRNPGVTRSRLMQNYHLMSREADAIFATLEQRGLVSRVRDGGAEKLYPVTQ
jgi:hypothetical protein